MYKNKKTRKQNTKQNGQVGPDAPEIMQGIAVAMRCRARKADFDGTVGIHPSAAEEFVTMRTRTRKVGGKLDRFSLFVFVLFLSFE